MIPSITHTVTLDCPTCGRSLMFNLTESMLIPPRASVPLRLENGHELSLDTTHYAESNQAVSRLIMVVITHCPTQPDPWYRLCQFWKTALDLETMTQYGKGSYPRIVPKHTRAHEEDAE